MHAVSIPSDQGESRMMHPFNVAMTALAMIATHAVPRAPLSCRARPPWPRAEPSSAQVEQIKGLREQATRELGSSQLDAIGQDVIVNMIKSGKWDEVAARKQLQTISDVQAGPLPSRPLPLRGEPGADARAESQAARDAGGGEAMY